MKNQELHYLAQDFGRYLTAARNLLARQKAEVGVDDLTAVYGESIQEVVSRLHPPTMRLRIVETIEETFSTRTFRFERTDGAIPPFRPGQYLNVYLEVDGVKTSRPYSISSAPGEDHLDLTVRIKPGGFVSPYLLESAKIGDEFLTTGPLGHFCYEPLIDRGDLVFLAGGSGITPFMSMLRDQARQGWPQQIHLIYGCRILEDVVFRRELDALSYDNPMLNYALVLSEEPSEEYQGVRGFITGSLIAHHVGNLEKATFFLCGPGAMYDFCLKELEVLNVPAHKIRKELYGPPEDITRQPGWPDSVSADDVFSVEIEGQTTIRARAGEPLLNSLERHHLEVPAQCRSGECSYCRIKLVSGEVFVPPAATVRESDRTNGYIHPCLTYPIGNLVVNLSN